MIRHVKFCLILFLIFLGQAPASDSQTVPLVQFGVGITLVDFQDVMPYDSYGAFMTPNLLLIALIKQRFKLEPMVAYYTTRKSSEDYTSSSRAFRYGMALYWLTQHNSLQMQFGGFIEQFNFQHHDTYNTDIYIVRSNGLAYGPAFAVEALFNTHFSIGATFQYQWQRATETRTSSGFRGELNTRETKRHIEHLRTKVVFRFYF